MKPIFVFLLESPSFCLVFQAYGCVLHIHEYAGYCFCTLDQSSTVFQKMGQRPTSIMRTLCNANPEPRGGGFAPPLKPSGLDLSYWQSGLLFGEGKKKLHENGTVLNVVHGNEPFIHMLRVNGSFFGGPPVSMGFATFPLRH